MNFGSFSQYLGIVRFLVEEQRKDLADAIREAKVPLQFADPIRSWFSGPVAINKPSLLVDDRDLILCERPATEGYAPYHSTLLTFLVNERRFPRAAVESIESTSTTLVTRLADPERNERFTIRGLVVGYIQSGKTTSMTALTARAADAGYKLVIVLAGLYNDLRSQTQQRFDQEITGQTDDPGDRPLVEQDGTAQKWSRLTGSGIQGEFDPGTHNDLNPATPKLAVVKKNVKVLDRFITWLSRSPVPLERLPALVIDDEADQASINSNYGKVDEDGDPIDPTRTNQLVRKLLALLPRCSYVGFTATPFANVLIDADVNDDLYPRDFIASLPEPVGYLGPRQLFGLRMPASDLAPDPPETPILEVIRPVTVDDSAQLSALTPGGSPPRVIEEAILAFVLSSCARMERGLGKSHFSMFIHPSYQTVKQETFRSVVSGHLDFLRVALGKPKHFPDVARRAQSLWESDFERTTRKSENGRDPAPFDKMWRHAREIVDAIELKVLNYNSTDVLDYRPGAPRRYLVIGGNRLSRGLTLEGLSVSVFLRDTNYYDTLLQMGRWFGYRLDYEDLTRIYVEDHMAELFADLARVELELRKDLAKYAGETNPPTPAQIMPRIRAHPVMLVTSRNKMGAGQTQNVSLGGSPRETVSFPVEDPGAIRQNIEVTGAFVRKLGKATRSTSAEGPYFWRGVQADRIIELVNSYNFAAAATVVNRPTVRAYIQELNRRGELREWDVVIPRGNPKLSTFFWADGIVSRKITRKPATRKSIRVLRSPGDLESWREVMERPEDDPSVAALILYAIDQSSKDPETAIGDANEDIIGLLFAFPTPKAYVPVPYVTQQPLL